MKIAVVTPIPTPYRDPFWNAVARRPGIDLHVFYCSAGKSDRPWTADWSREFQAEVLYGCNFANWRGRDASCFWNPDIVQRLQNGNYDAVVVGGYNHATMWVAMHHAHQHDIPLYLMCESFLRERRSSWRSRLKQYPVQCLVSRCAGGFPTGRLAEQYLTHYGAAPETLTRIANAPDVEGLKRSAERLRPHRAALRRRYGLSDRPTVLFVGRLIPKKRAGLLIKAFCRMCREDDVQLVVVGDGEEREMHEQLVKQLDMTRRVRFAGFAQPSDMPTWYALSDLFVLPSSETWGVVVLEALASGLPVIVTDEVGCHPDIVVDEVVGDVIPSANEQALAAALKKRLANPSSPDVIHRAWAPVRESLRYDLLAEKFISRLRGRTETHVHARAA
jgi:glycosyltransferase involved in cell wall biosynthesis